MVFFLFFKLEQNINSEKIIGTLAIFAAASFRIMPSINRIMMAFQSLRFGIPIINPILKNYILKAKIKYDVKKDKKIKFNKFSLRNIKFNYSGKQKIFDELNFSLNKNDKIAIVGKSGSGKTTQNELLFFKTYREKFI